MTKQTLPRKKLPRTPKSEALKNIFHFLLRQKKEDKFDYIGLEFLSRDELWDFTKWLYNGMKEKERYLCTVNEVETAFVKIDERVVLKFNKNERSVH